MYISEGSGQRISDVYPSASQIIHLWPRALRVSKWKEGVPTYLGRKTGQLTKFVRKLFNFFGEYLIFLRNILVLFVEVFQFLIHDILSMDAKMPNSTYR